MNCEDRFYKELSQVPEMPSGVYEKIARRAALHTTTRSSLIALAASLIMALGFFGLIDKKTQDVALQPEVADELQIISDYLNGDDLEQEFENYAFIGGF
jgi:hypothetical protein